MCIYITANHFPWHTRMFGYVCYLAGSTLFLHLTPVGTYKSWKHEILQVIHHVHVNVVMDYLQRILYVSSQWSLYHEEKLVFYDVHLSTKIHENQAFTVILLTDKQSYDSFLHFRGQSDFHVVQSIKVVGDQLPEEDLFVGIEGNQEHLCLKAQFPPLGAVFLNILSLLLSDIVKWRESIAITVWIWC